ncbi:MAG: B12-binding domain-containing radical SAM protein [Promethearchaeota archaeon]
MKYRGIYYKEPIFRPPSEARSLLIQATEGCTYQCSFCISNIGKPFKIRKVEEIKYDMDNAYKIYGPNVKRIFFLDGNAMVMPFDQLLEITKYAKNKFPNLERVGVYAHANDVLAKTDEQLQSLADVGLKIAYIGIESGDDEILKKIGKRITSSQIIEAFHKCFRAGITPSGTIILGLAGKNYELSRRHAIKSAELVNKASPTNIQNKLGNLPIWYISTLTLMIPPKTQIYDSMIKGLFVPMNVDEILMELKIFLEYISEKVKNCIFRSNHASNYLILKGVLSDDKENFLKLIEENLKTHKNIRPEFFRAL